MTDLRLFAVPEPVAEVQPPDRLSADARRTQRQRELLAAGRHPATNRPLFSPDTGLKCGDCAHATPLSNGNRSWWKCERHRLGMSHSAASDIRVSWPACTLFRVNGGTAADEATAGKTGTREAARCLCRFEPGTHRLIEGSDPACPVHVLDRSAET